MQAVGRIRAIRATTQERIVLISGVPTLPANRLIAWRDFIGEEKVDRFAELLVRENGAALLSRGKLANDHPDLFPTVATARGAVRRMVEDPPTEVPTGIADVTVPVTVMRGKVRGAVGAMTPVLTTLAGQSTAVAISRKAGADALVEEPKPEPKAGELPPLRGPRHYVMRADPVEVEIPPKLDQNS